jgi:16S rRNA (adenine1518-N6/adenine1519-N6)-dimethyltransferase
MDLLPETKRLLRLYRIFPKKRLGQNFVVNSNLLQQMISYTGISKEDVVLEVGAGLGFLTRLLSKTCKRVITIEIDPKLVEILQSQLHDLSNVNLIEGDILSTPVPKFDKVVSTPPYSISSPLLFWLLEKRFDYAVLTFQEEFARRLAASVDSKDYGRLTVTTYYRAKVDLFDHVPRNMFHPPPDVDSIIVRLKPRKPPFYVQDKKTFFKLVQMLFTQKNRKVRNAIVPFLRDLNIKKTDITRLADSFSYRDRRVRELAPEDFGTLTNEVMQLCLRLQ